MKLKKLLFITSNRLGDAVLSTGALDEALRRFTPDEVTIACGPIPAPLFAGVPKLKEILLLDKQEKGLHWLKLWYQTVTQQWDMVIDIRNSIVSYIIPARQVLRFTQGDPAQHKSVQLAGAFKFGQAPYNKIWLSEAAMQRADQLMPGDKPILALCPTANWIGKTWPPDHFISAARLLLKAQPKLAGGAVAIFGAAHERPQMHMLVEELKKDFPVIDLVGKTDPLEAAACLSRCTLCIANDSGLMHIAAAMGTPTLGLFGPSNDKEYAPHGPRADFVRGAPYREASFIQDADALMRAISVETAVAAASKLL